jgi:hypothetical protein
MGAGLVFSHKSDVNESRDNLFDSLQSFFGQIPDEYMLLF